MKIAVISDIHDHVIHLQKALDYCQEAHELIVCGDLCSPFVVDLIGEAFSGPVHMVIGNNDGDLFRISSKLTHRVILHGEFAELIEVDGQLLARKDFEQLYKLDYFDRSYGKSRIAITHFPDIAQAVFQSNLYEYICFGHNHQYSVTHEQQVIMINPGSLMGYLPGKKLHIPPSFAIIDTENHQIHGLEIIFSVKNGNYVNEILKMGIGV